MPQAGTEALLNLVIALTETEPCCDEGLRHAAPAKGSSERRAKGLFLWFCYQKFVLSVLFLNLAVFPTVIFCV